MSDWRSDVCSSDLQPEQIVPVHRVNTALSLLRVRPGYVICPSMARSLVEGFGLVFVPLCQPAVSWRIALFARSRPSLSPAVESFLDYVLETAQTDGGGRAPRSRAAAASGGRAGR